MDLDQFVGEGWRDHQDHADDVLARLPEGIGLVTEAGQLPKLAGLIVHVAGEHCGRWDEGLGLLGQLTEHEAFDGGSPEGKAVWRSMAVLHLCAGNQAEHDACMERGRSGDDSEASDEIRVKAIAASTLAGQSRTDEAITAFSRALELAEYGPGKDDPAARALAVTGHNLACELEMKGERSEQEARLMLQAAETSRRFWEIAGTWMNVERAEYRLSHTNLQLGNADDALTHARQCLEICEANDAPVGEMFFAHEVLARSWHAKGDPERAVTHRDYMLSRLGLMEDAGFRSFCEAELAKLETLLGDGSAA